MKTMAKTISVVFILMATSCGNQTNTPATNCPAGHQHSTECGHNHGHEHQDCGHDHSHQNHNCGHDHDTQESFTVDAPAHDHEQR